MGDRSPLDICLPFRLLPPFYSYPDIRSLFILVYVLAVCLLSLSLVRKWNRKVRACTYL